MELWQSAPPIVVWKLILNGAGEGDKTNVLVVMSCSGHPGPWLAGLELNTVTYVFTEKVSEHSQQHGIALGKHLRRKALRVAPGGSAGAEIWDPKTHSISAEIKGSQFVDAYSISQWSLWNDGLNACLPAGVLQTSMKDLVASELEEFDSAKTPVDENP